MTRHYFISITFFSKENGKTLGSVGRVFNVTGGILNDEHIFSVAEKLKEEWCKSGEWKPSSCFYQINCCDFLLGVDI